MNAPDLIEAARTLAESGDAPPKQARLRRAVSTAYYAMFHTLAASAADLFIGPTRSAAWHQAYLASGVPGIGARQGQERVSARADDAGVPSGNP